jgi:hypothetical protein
VPAGVGTKHLLSIAESLPVINYAPNSMNRSSTNEVAAFFLYCLLGG